ncbi:MAG: hypothetical protein ACRESJ_09630 [Pseudomonas sp.]|uniref:hypothetical protein n=1 Tax=Pseudomonas sp. TaxID=306 RepID=UPI003D6EB3A7
MARVILELEVDTQLYRLLKSSAETNHLSLEEECCRRLMAERRSSYLQALLAELRAEDEQRRANSD